MYFSHTAPPLTPERREELLARDVRIVDGEVVGIESSYGRVRGVRLADGTVVDREVLVVGAPVRVSSPVLDDLGIVREPVVVGGVEVGDRYPPVPAAPRACRACTSPGTSPTRRRRSSPPRPRGWWRGPP